MKERELTSMADANNNHLPLRGITFVRKACEGTQTPSANHDQISCEQSVFYDSYIGSADALLKAGVVDARLLSERIYNTGATMVAVGPSGEKWEQGYIEITARSDCLLEIKAGISELERTRRKAAWEARAQSERESAALRTAKQLEALELLELPRSHQQYKDDCVRALRAHLNIVRNTVIAANKYSGFHFDGDALRVFDRAVEELVKTVLHGDSRFVPAMQERRISEIKSQSARADMRFQNFLQYVTACTDDTRNPPA
jgi:hypothetical protein